jgi:hypothetical protein
MKAFGEKAKGLFFLCIMRWKMIEIVKQMDYNGINWRGDSI